MDQAGGASLRRQRELCERLESDIAAARDAATKTRVVAEKKAKEVAKAQKEVEALEAEAGEVEALIEAKRQELVAMEDEALGVLEAAKAKEAERDAHRGTLEEIRAEHEAREKEKDDVLEVMGNLRRVRGELERQHKEELKKARFWEAQSSKAAAARLDPAAAPETEALGGALSADELAGIEAGDHEDPLVRVKYEVVQLEAALGAMEPDLGAIEEYRTRSEAYSAQIAALDGITARRDALRKEHEALRKRRLDEFMAGFNIISLKLKEMYQMITLGGDAELELVDSLDPFSEGIVFSVRPPRKSWKNIGNLSGGEKTLSSLALVFALHHFRPTPLYVMDEIDAALDFRNVSIVGHYIKERTKDAQFVIISLRNNMFELADRLVGIYKTHNQTKSVTIDPHSFVVAAQAKGPAGQAAGAEQVPPATPAPVAV